MSHVTCVVDSVAALCCCFHRNKALTGWCWISATMGAACSLQVRSLVAIPKRGWAPLHSHLSAACAFAVVIHTGVQVARSLINSGDIVLIADANGVRDIYSANGGALDSSTPMSVLVNKGTASASEVG